MPGVVSSPFPPARPAFPALRVAGLLSGCPLSSLAGTPLHVVCAFRGLGPVALLVFPACPLCVCALALSRRPPPPPPGLVWRAHPARSRCWALVGPFHSVRAPPRVVPRFLCSVWLAWGGGGPVLFPPTLGLGAARSPGVGAGVGIRQQPHRARCCELALRAGLARCRGGTRAPGGGAACLGAGRPGSSALPAPTTRLFGRATGAHYQLSVGAGGASVGTRHQSHSARFLGAGFARCCGGMRVPGGAPRTWVRGIRGRALSHPPPLVLSGVRPGPTTHWLWVRGMRAWGPVTNPTARTLACWLCALWGRQGGARGGGLLPGCGASGVGRSPRPGYLFFRACSRGPLPTGCGCGGHGRGDPSPTPQRALLRAGFARCGGSMRVPGGCPSCLGVGRPGSGALPPPTSRPFGRVARARFPLAVGAVCRREGPAVLGTFSCAAVRCVLCALPGFPAPGGRSGLAPVLVLWFRPAACLSGVPRGPALVRRASSGPVALGAPVGLPVAVVPSPTPGAVALGFTGWLRGARGGPPRTGLFVPASGPCRGKEAGLAPRCTLSGPRDGVVPGGSLRLRSWAACAAVVFVRGPGH